MRKYIMRIGILGGTFDPIHNGHLYLAKKVLNKLSLDKVIFIPTYIPPHKKACCIASSLDRYNMIKLAIEGKKYFSVSRIELDRKGKSYSIDTVKALKKKYGKTSELFFITGSDSLKVLGIWKDLDKMLKLCKFVVVKRPGHILKKASDDFIFLDINALDISSTDIRKRMTKHQPVFRLMPEKVKGYIKKYRLYETHILLEAGDS